MNKIKKHLALIDKNRELVAEVKELNLAIKHQARINRRLIEAVIKLAQVTKKRRNVISKKLNNEKGGKWN